MEILLDVTQSPGGRLTGTARLPDSRHALLFSGTMELVASVEQLCGVSPLADPVSSPSGATAADGPGGAWPQQSEHPRHG
jgi:hypothetical protein